MRNWNKNRVIYTAAVLLSFLFIFVGSKIASVDLNLFKNRDVIVEKAKIDKIIKREDNSDTLIGMEGVEGLQNVTVTVRAKVIAGQNKGDTFIAKQYIDPIAPVQMKEVRTGDKVLILGNTDMNGMVDWSVVEYVRSDALFIFGLLFVIAILLFGQKRGLNTLLSLGFTCAAIFLILVPAILSGKNIYACSIIVSIFIILMTMLIVIGANKKSLAAGLGCFSGVVVTGTLTLIMDQIIQLTGFVDEQSFYLIMINENDPINLRAIVFSGIIIGAIGAIMDVSMDIASALFEVHSSLEKPTFARLFHSGMNIGRDILGTMANTLILAYIGGSLSIVLVLASNNQSLIYLMNIEMIVVEILQALAGSFGILFAIPFTAAICGFLYPRQPKDRKPRGPKMKKGIPCEFPEWKL